MAQTFFPIDPVEVVPPTTQLNWGDVDLSALIPAGSTGAIVRIYNSDTGVKSWGIRKKGSTDARIQPASGRVHCWGIIGVDATQRLQFNNVDAFPGKVSLWVVGYTMVGITMLTNGVLISSGIALNAWTAVDLSAQVPVGTLGVIVEVLANAGTYLDWGLRENGSTDSRIDEMVNRKNQFCGIIGVDGNRKIEGYREVGNVLMYLLGYITDGATFLLDGTDITPTPTGAWTDLTPLPGGGVIQGIRQGIAQRFFLTGYAEGGRMAFVEITGAGKAGVRKNAAFLSPYDSVTSHIWGISEAEGGGGGGMCGLNPALPELMLH